MNTLDLNPKCCWFGKALSSILIASLPRRMRLGVPNIPARDGPGARGLWELLQPLRLHLRLLAHHDRLHLPRPLHLVHLLLQHRHRHPQEGVSDEGEPDPIPIAKRCWGNCRSCECCDSTGEMWAMVGPIWFAESPPDKVASDSVWPCIQHCAFVKPLNKTLHAVCNLWDYGRTLYNFERFPHLNLTFTFSHHGRKEMF